MRLTHPQIRPVAAPVRIRFDGQPLEALPGETLAAALSAAGILAFRAHAGGRAARAVLRHGRLLRLRGDGRRPAGQRACLAKAQDGMQVASAPPAALAAAGRAAGGDDRTATATCWWSAPAPPGLAAARRRRRGRRPVVVLDERGEPGGQYLKPLAASHAACGAGRASSAKARRCVPGRARPGPRSSPAPPSGAASRRMRCGAVVGERRATFRPRRLVLAPGAHERPVPVPGWTLPGVMTTGALQTLARANGSRPASRVVIAGNGPLNLQLACELLAGGVQVAAVVEAAPRPGLGQWRERSAMCAPRRDLAWDGLATCAMLQRAGVPVLWGSHVRGAARARARFAALHVGHAGGRACASRPMPCALNAGFQPETGLARALDLQHRSSTTGSASWPR